MSVTSVSLPPEQAWTFARLPGVLASHVIKPISVVHIGAHHGEEVPIYRECGFGPITLVEPDPGNVAVLRERFGADQDIFIIGAACVPKASARGAKTTLYRAQRSVWSGLQPHPSAATGDTVQVATVTPDHVLGEANVVVLDTQGTELDLLAACRLDLVDLVIIETSLRVKDTAAFHNDVVVYMDRRGWAVAEEWIHDDSGYHDVLFVRRSVRRSR